MVKSVTLLLAALCGSQVGLAQVARSAEPSTSPGSFQSFAPGEKTYALEQAQQALADRLGFKASTTFERVRTYTDQRGGIHERYLQYYQGIPVECGVYLVHAQQGRIASMNGVYQPVGRLDVTASVPESEALQQALRAVGAKRYTWQDVASSEQPARLAPAPAPQTLPPVGTLVVVGRLVPALQLEEPTLAWRFTISATEPRSAQQLYVDAHSGRVLGRVNLLQDATPALSLARPLSLASTLATGETFHSGKRDLQTELNKNNDYILRSRSAGQWDIWTMWAAPNGSPAPPYPIPTLSGNPSGYQDFINSTRYWPQSFFAATRYTGGDAHWGAQLTDEFFRRLFGRNSFDNQGSPIVNTFTAPSHVGGNATYSPPGTSGMTSGAEINYWPDVNANERMPSIDIVAHEFGHGVDISSAQVAYNATLESGSISEGLSDVWGACLTAYAGEQNIMWKFGSRSLGSNYRPLDDPNSTSHPDSYNGQYYYTTGPLAEIHQNATVFSHWFYLLSEGFTKGRDGSAVQGMGWKEAARLMYLAQTQYFFQGMSFENAREATLLATDALYGPGSTYYSGVAKCWYNVNVGSGSYRLATPSPVGSHHLYPNPATASTTIELAQTVDAPLQATVYTTQGQAVKTVLLTEQRTLVDLHELPAGLYYVRYVQDDKPQSYLLRIER